MRPAATQYDRELDEALIWDFFGHRYGWTKRTVEEDLPRWLPPRLLEIGSIRAELEREESERHNKSQ